MGVDGIQPHGDPVWRGQSFGHLVVPTISIRARVACHRRELTERKLSSRSLAASLSVRAGGTLSSRSYMITSDRVSKDFRSILSEDAGTDGRVHR